MERGYYITICGVEGTGKTSQLFPLRDYLTSKGIPLIITREPGGTEIGDVARSLLLKREGEIPSPETELMLYMTSRAQGFSRIIIPNLKNGVTVLADRCFLETEAYQGYGRGFDLNFIRKLNAFVTKDTFPDITFLIDGDPEVTLLKALGRIGKVDRMESEPLKFHKKVREGFLEIAKYYSNFIITIPYRENDPEAMQQEIQMHLNKRLNI